MSTELDVGQATAWSANDRARIVEIYRRHLSVGRASLAEMMAAPLEVQSSGAYIRTPDAREILDCGGYGVFIVGHCHPRVVEAVVQQVRRHPMHTSVLVEPAQALAAQALVGVAPAGLDGVRFTNSGAEATEVALKLARMHGKRRIINASNGFHGKTLGALSATPSALYQRPFAPLFPSATAQFGDAEDLKRILQGHDDSCVIIEPIQGEGGVVVPPPGYLNDVVELCKRHDALLIFDEIQVGLGRTGRWWAAERDGATPDLMLVGKGLSGGVVPAAAVLATDQVYRPFSEDPVLHSSTFAGSPIAMAAARAAIETIREEDLVRRADELGTSLFEQLDALVAAEAKGLVREVRGAGLLIGIEFYDPSVVIDLMLELLDRDVLVNHSFNAHGVLRLTPPAVLQPTDVERLLEAMTAGLRAVAAVHGVL